MEKRVNKRRVWKEVKAYSIAIIALLLICLVLMAQGTICNSYTMQGEITSVGSDGSIVTVDDQTWFIEEKYPVGTEVTLHLNAKHTDSNWDDEVVKVTTNK